MCSTSLQTVLARCTDYRVPVMRALCPALFQTCAIFTRPARTRCTRVSFACSRSRFSSDRKVSGSRSIPKSGGHATACFTHLARSPSLEPSFVVSISLARAICAVSSFPVFAGDPRLYQLSRLYKRSAQALHAKRPRVLFARSSSPHPRTPYAHNVPKRHFPS